ncbi:MAG: hypothetical protein KDD43_06600 [Bdellovibrionales bacterium]|nr:hypothetical protein [Bdellovibrionales bacterium]
MSRLLHITFLLLILTVLSACSSISISASGQADWSTSPANPQVDGDHKPPQALVYRMPLDAKYPR